MPLHWSYAAETAWPINEDRREARVSPPTGDTGILVGDTGGGTLVLLVTEDISATDLRTSSVSRISALISLACSIGTTSFFIVGSFEDQLSVCLGDIEVL